jgi:deoxyribonuclease IV
MPAQLLGAHMPASGGLPKALRNAKEMGCTAVQVFTSSPQQWRSKPVTDEMAADFRAAVKETGLSALVSHDSYLINLCSTDPGKLEQSIEAMKSEIGRCSAYGIPYVVSHMGAHMGQGEELGLQKVAESLGRVLAETPPDVTVCMETTAGQGSALMAKFEQLTRVLDLLDWHERIGICLDTCHVFVAGYDLRTQETYQETWRQFDKTVGLPRLKVIHCNDSKKGLGSRVDRHAHIGDGELGDEPFRLLVNDPRFERVPIVLETEVEDQGHERDLAKLRSLMT